MTEQVIWYPKCKVLPEIDTEIIVATHNGLFPDVQFATWTGKKWIDLVLRVEIGEEMITAWCCKPEYK